MGKMETGGCGMSCEKAAMLLCSLLTVCFLTNNLSPDF
ncbi:hypothetical protein QSI_2514 [Clostridioides difficile P28]|nr:hypothetical protein QSI_2514 [Clostridioides difficile P28]